MKNLIFAMALTLGCGGATRVEEDSTQMKQRVEDTDSARPQTVGAGSYESSLTAGEWKNGSCGERHYLRVISFKIDGTFEARDEVAPCPEGAECVSSGIIVWGGTWTMEDSAIALSPETVEGGRLPDQVPQSFFVLGHSPLAIAEKTGQLVCPYRKDH